MSNGDPLTEISDTARMLAKLGPELDAKLNTSLEQLGICRREESLQSQVADLSHEVEVCRKLQGELGQKMHRLILLTAQHLPGCNLATLTAVERDWSEVVAELNRIESKALEASVKSQEPDDDDAPITTDEAKRILGTKSDASLNRWAKDNGIERASRGKWRKADILKLKLKRGKLD